MTEQAIQPQPVPSSETPATSQPKLIRGLSLMDSVLFIIGGTVGSAIFLTPTDVAKAVPAPLLYMLVWIAGGVVAMMAAFAFGELGAMYPEAGGQYVYLREAFGDFSAFLYGWLMFIAGNTGGIATISVAFAVYLGKVVPALGSDRVLMTMNGVGVQSWHLVSKPWHLTRGDVVAVGAIVLLTIVNVLGLRRGVILQNIATWLKYVALAAFVVFGFLIGKGNWSNFAVGGTHAAFAGGLHAFSSIVGVAFIAVFWCYDGWVYVSWTAGEVRDPERNIPRSLVLGIAAVIALYLAANAVYIYAMPLANIAQAETIGQAAAATLFSPRVAFWFAAVIAISCFGATSSNVLGGARVSYAMAKDRLFFHRLGDVHPRYRTPAMSLVAQAFIAGAIALTGTYDQLFTFTEFGMALSYVACVIALFVLRRTQPEKPRPYRCFGYPWIPGAYVILIGGWLLNTSIERPVEAYACLGLAAIGVPGYVYWKRSQKQQTRSQ